MVGLLALGPRLSERGYSHDDRRLLDTLARYAAPALRLGQMVRQQEGEARDLQRIEQELQVAQLIQQQFLPQSLPNLAGWDLSRVLPARRARSAVTSTTSWSFPTAASWWSPAT